MSAFQAFSPAYGTGQSLSAAGTPALASLKKNTKSVRVVNAGENPLYFKVGSGSIVATTSDYYLPVGVIEIITKSDDETAISYFSPSGSTLNIIEGEGL